MENFHLFIYFFAGLSLGGFTCLAVQGGLLASVIASQKIAKNDLAGRVVVLLSFLISKLVAYTLLGFILGFFGQAIVVSEKVRIFMQLLAGVYMVLVALNLLNVHPLLRFVIFQPPQSIGRLLRLKSRSKEIFAPAILGFLTVLIPCGTTLAIEGIALSSGNPMISAAILASFTLGTIPVFFGIGILTSALSSQFRKTFIRFAALFIIFVGIISINGSLRLLASPITLDTIYNLLPIELNLESSQLGSRLDNNGIQVADIAISNMGYKPSSLTVKQGVPLKLNLVTSDGLGCANDFRIPALNISKMLHENSNDSIEFTPKDKGKLTWTCSSGLFKGELNII